MFQRIQDENKKMLTQLPDVDREILLKLDEREFLEICSPPKSSYSRKLCNEDLFRKRLVLKYPSAYQYKPENQTWKKYYLSTSYYINKLKEEEIPYNLGNPKEEYENFPSYLKDDVMAYLSLVGYKGKSRINRSILLDFYISNLRKIDGKYILHGKPISFQELLFLVNESFIPYKELDNTDKLYLESLKV